MGYCIYPKCLDTAIEVRSFWDDSAVSDLGLHCLPHSEQFLSTLPSSMLVQCVV